MLARRLAGKKGIRQLISVAHTPALAALCPEPALVGDEDRLPIPDASADLVTSCLALHWVDDRNNFV